MNARSLTRRCAGLLSLSACMGLSAAALAQTADAPIAGLTAAKLQHAVVARVWHGKTPKAKADEYQQYLSDAIRKFPTIKGNLGYQMMRLDGGPDGSEYVEFQVVSYWESLESIKAYAGENISRTRDLPKDKDFLVNMEPHVRNYQLLVNAIQP